MVDKINVILFMLFVLGIIALLGYIQWRLSKLAQRFYAFILPGISLLLAFVACFGFMMYTGNIGSILVQFLMLNVPTIYFVCISAFVKNTLPKKHR